MADHWDVVLYLIEFLHQTTTCRRRSRQVIPLYLIEFLHQTTTSMAFIRDVVVLYLIEFLHQTTTWMTKASLPVSCILLNFYIKPQPC